MAYRYFTRPGWQGPPGRARDRNSTHQHWGSQHNALASGNRGVNPGIEADPPAELCLVACRVPSYPPSHPCYSRLCSFGRTRKEQWGQAMPGHPASRLSGLEQYLRVPYPPALWLSTTHPSGSRAVRSAGTSGQPAMRRQRQRQQQRSYYTLETPYQQRQQ